MNSRSIKEVTDAKLTATVLLKKGLSKIHKPPFKDFSQEFQDDVSKFGFINLSHTQ